MLARPRSWRWRDRRGRMAGAAAERHIICTGCGSAPSAALVAVACSPIWETGLSLPATACSRRWPRPSWSTVPRHLVQCCGWELMSTGSSPISGRRSVRSPSASWHGGASDVEAELSKADVERLWRCVATATNWWLDIPAYEPGSARAPVHAARRGAVGSVLHDQPSAKRRRRRAAADAGLARAPWILPPSVLTTPAGSRGEVARASLRLDLALDDRLVNCLEIIRASNSKALLIARRARSRDA